MNVKILGEKYDKLSMEVKGSNPAFMNALRRIVLSEVPVLAVNFVNFKANSSAMYDETLAQRLGLIPLKFKPGDFKLPEECNCKGEGCPNCQVSLVLKKEGPGTVYSKDMKSTSKNVKPLYNKIPIVELDKGQKLDLEAVATLGKGEEHAKWQASNPSYKYYPEIEIDTKKCDLCGECVKSCPKNILKKGKTKILIKKPEECSICRECVEKCKPKAITVKGNENRFLFRIESVSGLEPGKILRQGLDILESKLKKVKKAS